MVSSKSDVGGLERFKLYSGILEDWSSFQRMPRSSVLKPASIQFLRLGIRRARLVVFTANTCEIIRVVNFAHGQQRRVQVPSLSQGQSARQHLLIPSFTMNAQRSSSRALQTLRTSSLNIQRGCRRVHTLPPLQTLVSTSSPEFVERATAMNALVNDLKKDLSAIREGGKFVV